MRRILISALATTLLAAGCGNGEVGDGTTTLITTTSPSQTVTTSTEPTPSIPTTATTTTAATPTTSTTTTSTVPPPLDRPVAPLAWGLLCRDLAAAGWSYPGAVAYWEVEGRPARMDADENGIPCETVYSSREVTAYWGDPLPTGLAPGPGSGWRPSSREEPVTGGCCETNHNGPESPPLPPESGPWPHDGAFSVWGTREEGVIDRIELEIRRWLPCSEQPDQCGPVLFPGDVYSDRDNSVVRTVGLDEELLVVIRPIACRPDGTWAEAPIEGSGAAFGALLRRVDAAALEIGPDYGTIDLEARGTADPTYPFGPVPCEENAPVLGYRGPEGSYLTETLYAIYVWDEPDWMYGWRQDLEVVDGEPILYIWAGQIAG